MIIIMKTVTAGSCDYHMIKELQVAKIVTIFIPASNTDWMITLSNRIIIIIIIV